MEQTKRVRVPNPASIEAAIETYYSKIELQSADIKTLFGVCRSTAQLLKAWAQEVQEARGKMPINGRACNTKIAYEAWGLDIADLETRYAKLRKLEKMRDGAK